MPVVAGEVLVAFERVVDDWTQRGPAGERRRTSAERVVANRDVWKCATGLWACFVDHAEVSIQEDAPFPEFSRIREVHASGSGTVYSRVTASGVVPR